MQIIIQWIIDNWQLVASVLLFVLSFILQLLKKKPNESMFETLFKACVLGIEFAENSYPKGENGKYSFEKVNEALDVAAQYLYKKYPKIDFDQYEKQCRLLIEAILSTPQKHEK